MNLTPHFTLAELTVSETAARKGIDNQPSIAIAAELQKTAELLEHVRRLVERPVLVTSGYRCAALNLAIGGAPGSAHMFGRAADFHVPGYGPPRSLYEFLATFAESLRFDQLILEYDAWVHIGRAPDAQPPRCQVFTIGC